MFKLIPMIEQTDKFRKFIPIEKITENFSIYKGFESSIVIDKFVELAYKINLIISFDWMHWE